MSEQLKSFRTTDPWNISFDISGEKADTMQLECIFRVIGGQGLLKSTGHALPLVPELFFGEKADKTQLECIFRVIGGQDLLESKGPWPLCRYCDATGSRMVFGEKKLIQRSYNAYFFGEKADTTQL